MIRHSATLVIDERMRARRAVGEKVLHLGFGEAGLPVLPGIRRILADSAGANDYGPVIGSPGARTAAAGYLSRRGLPTGPEQVIFGPGSKSLLFALLTVLPGDVVLPVPSWVTYAAQAALVGKAVIGVPIPERAGGVPDPDLLAAALDRARAEGRRPGILVLTVPDNPTGTVAGRDLVERVCAIAERYGLVVVSDEIYRDLAHDPANCPRPADFLPERTVVTSGLSKGLALGGYRIGFLRLPAGSALPELRDGVVGVASEVWSSLAAPMQEVAAWALDEPVEVADQLAASRTLHGTVASAVHRVFVEAGADCRPPAAAFYLYPDLSALRPPGVGTDAELAELLLDRHGIGVLPGAEFGDDPAALRFRVATSLLYGETEDQRWQSLRSPQPLALPWIAAALDDLRAALVALPR